MQIKKFKAKTLKEAIAEMKNEFGDEAIVLSTKVIDSFTNGVEQKIFEITASIDEDGSQEVVESVRKESKTQDFQTEMKKLTERVYGVQGQEKKETKVRVKTQSKPEVKSNLVDIKTQLLDKDIKLDIVDNVIKKISQYSPFVDKENRDDYIISTLGSMIPTSDFQLSKQSKPKIISLVGPTGVGKTTCIAKHLCGD